MAKRIIWSDTANEELKTTLEFYTQRNGSAIYSLKLLNELEDILNTLSESNFIGRLTSNKKTRVIPMKVYLIFYESDEDTIEILSFCDNRQDDNTRKIKI